MCSRPYRAHGRVGKTPCGVIDYGDSAPERRCSRAGPSLPQAPPDSRGRGWFAVATRMGLICPSLRPRTVTPPVVSASVTFVCPAGPEPA